MNIGSRISFRSIVASALIIVLALCILGYIIFQSRLLIQGPVVEITNQLNPAQNSRFVTLEGRTKNITHLALNGRQIYTDEYGYFREELFLENGYNIATISAVDRYGRTTEVVQDFVYIPISFPDNT